VSLFDLLPVWVFLALAALGILLGFGLRLLLHDRAARGAGRRETRYDRFSVLLGLFSQSAAIGLALTLVVDLFLAARETNGRVLAGVTVLVAAVTSFGAAYLRELIRRVFYKS
jgi:hypothetical protein